jgi:hypothetical protein
MKILPLPFPWLALRKQKGLYSTAPKGQNKKFRCMAGCLQGKVRTYRSSAQVITTAPNLGGALGLLARARGAAVSGSAPVARLAFENNTHEFLA